MRHGFMAVLPAVLFACVFSCLFTACNGKNGPTGPAGQPVTFYVTPTPSTSAPAHTFMGAWGGPVTGSALGQFNNPSGLFVDGAGDIYVADNGNNRIQEIPSAGNAYVAWGGAGTAPGEFSNPNAVALDAAGDLWVTDQENNRLQELPAGSSTWITIGAVSGGAGPGQFGEPSYLTFDRSGNLYVSDPDNSRIQELPAGKAATVAANWVTFGSYGNGPGLFHETTGVAVDASGNLWVADAFNNYVQELPAGKAGAVPANWVVSYGGLSGQFDNPYGVGTDPSGDLYVTDLTNNRIDELPAGKPATVAANWITIGGFAAGSAPGQFHNPEDVKTDSQGNVYVADSLNNRIVKLSP